jgi:hypothetical protein
MQIFLVEIKVIKEVCIYTYIYEERLGRRNNKNQKKEKKKCIKHSIISQAINGILNII